MEIRGHGGGDRYNLEKSALLKRNTNICGLSAESVG
jgi:hypothetical protein